MSPLGVRARLNLTVATSKLTLAVPANATKLRNIVVALEQKKLIVAIDDEQSNLDLLVRALSRDYRMITFVDPLVALAEIPRLNPALILTDQRMPGLNGVDLLAQLREKGVSCPALLVTGFAAETDVARAEQERLVEGIIAKPWRLAVLVAKVKSTLP
jgi:CheY-like chemotaxis protein